MTPATGTVWGGQAVTITGTNLANAIVSIGAQSVVPTTVSADHKHLTFRTPLAAAGLAGVRVSTPLGATAQVLNYTLRQVAGPLGDVPALRVDPARERRPAGRRACG